MCPGLDPTLVVTREANLGRSTEIDKVAEQTLLCAGEQDLDVEWPALGLGFDGKGSKKIGSVDIDIDRVVHGCADDLGVGKIIGSVEQVDFGGDAATLRIGVQTRDRVLALDATVDTVDDRSRLAVEALDCDVTTRVDKLEVLDESVCNVADRQTEVGALDRERLERV